MFLDFTQCPLWRLVIGQCRLNYKICIRMFRQIRIDDGRPHFQFGFITQRLPPVQLGSQEQTKAIIG